ncbi:MAG: hypothetical protein LBH06_09640 [Rikenellaceae bacterium]|nr:hypothetical protein [Rikenellaceae bacterium]
MDIRGDFRQYLHLYVGGCCEVRDNGSVLSRTSRVKLGQPYRILRHRYDGGSGDSFFILVAFGTPDYPDGLYTLTNGRMVPGSKLRPAYDKPTAFFPDPFRPQTL